MFLFVFFAPWISQRGMWTKQNKNCILKISKPFELIAKNTSFLQKLMIVVPPAAKSEN